MSILRVLVGTKKGRLRPHSGWFGQVIQRSDDGGKTWNTPDGSVLNALEARHPVLRGMMRDHGALRPRRFIRFFACREDLSLQPAATPLPEAVASGAEPFLVVGAMAGG